MATKKVSEYDSVFKKTDVFVFERTELCEGVCDRNFIDLFILAETMFLEN